MTKRKSELNTGRKHTGRKLARKPLTLANLPNGPRSLIVSKLPRKNLSTLTLVSKANLALAKTEYATRLKKYQAFFKHLPLQRVKAIMDKKTLPYTADLRIVGVPYDRHNYFENQKRNWRSYYDPLRLTLEDFIDLPYRTNDYYLEEDNIRALVILLKPHPVDQQAVLGAHAIGLIAKSYLRTESRSHENATIRILDKLSAKYASILPANRRFEFWDAVIHRVAWMEPRLQPAPFLIKLFDTLWKKGRINPKWWTSKPNKLKSAFLGFEWMNNPEYPAWLFRFISAGRGKEFAARFLLRHGEPLPLEDIERTDPMVRSKRGHTVLHTWAARTGYYNGNGNINPRLKQFLQQANASALNSDGRTPMYYTTVPKKLRTLANMGVDMRTKNKNNRMFFEQRPQLSISNTNNNASGNKGRSYSGSGKSKSKSRSGSRS